MNRCTVLLLGLSLALGADAALGRGGNSGGHGGGRTAGFHGGHAIGSVRVGPVFAGARFAPVARSPRFFHRGAVFVGGAVVLAAPFYPYPYPYPYPYYPPAYTEPPAYVEQGGNVYYYCPDYRDYYPNVASCPSPWMKVLP
jgi:hypothetical protein